MNSHLDIHSTATPNESAYVAHRSDDQGHAHRSDDQSHAHLSDDQSHAHLSDDQSHAHLSDDQSHAHLSDDQIDDQLLGDLAAGPAAHLAACAVCTDRVAAAANPLASFRNVTLAWSERRAATLPLPDLSQQTPLWQRHVAGAMACFAIVLGIALINASHQATIRTAELQPMPLQSTPLQSTQQEPLQQTATQQTATQQTATQQIATQQTATQQIATQQEPTQQAATRQAPPQPPVLTETASIAVTPRAQQISSDNRMLKAIDAELDTSADSLAALGIEPVSAHPGRPPTPISIQD